MKFAWTKAAALVLLALGASPLMASEYIALRFPPAKEPAVYLRFYKETVRVADSAKGLENARKVSPLPDQTRAFEADPQTGAKMISYGFPELPVSLSIGGFDSIVLTPHVFRTTTPGTQRERAKHDVVIPINVRFLKRDAAGVVWSYSYTRLAEGVLSTDETSPTILDAPPPTDLKLTVEAQLDEEEKNVGIGARLRVGEVVVEMAMKGDVPAPAHLEVLDSSGQPVHSQDGDLAKFSFG